MTNIALGIDQEGEEQRDIKEKRENGESQHASNESRNLEFL